MREEYKKGGLADPGDFPGSLIVNILMRIVGFVIRLIVIIFGLAVLIITTIGGVVTLDTTEELVNIYKNKFSEKISEYADNILFSFKPMWWRYVDWNKPEGKTTLNSDGTIVVS